MAVANCTQAVGIKTYHYALAESTFGSVSSTKIAGTDAFLPDVAIVFSVDQKRTPREDYHPAIPDLLETDDMGRDVTWTFQSNLLGAGTGNQGAAPDLTAIYQTMFTEDATDKATTVASDVALNTMKLTADKLDADEIGMVTLDSGKAHMFYVASKDISDVLTIYPPAPTAFSVGAAVSSVVYYALAQPASAVSIHRSDNVNGEIGVGCKLNELSIQIDSTAIPKQTLSGMARDRIFNPWNTLNGAIYADYAFSRAGAGGDPSLISASVKQFGLLAYSGGAADPQGIEQVVLAGTESTWLAVVNALNGGILAGLTGTINKACVAVLIGSGNGTGMYIRAGATGSGKDVLLSNGTSNSCAAALDLGAANGGVELDADELYLDYASAEVGAVFYIDTELVKITAVDSSDDTLFTVTRGFGATTPAAHSDNADVAPYQPAQTTAGQRIFATNGYLFLGDDAVEYKYDQATITITNNVMGVHQGGDGGLISCYAYPQNRSATLQLILHCTKAEAELMKRNIAGSKHKGSIQAGNVLGRSFYAYWKAWLADTVEIPDAKGDLVRVTMTGPLFGVSGNDSIKWGV